MLDVLSQIAPQVRIVEVVQTVLYGLLYLVIAVCGIFTAYLCGIFTAYLMQRFAFPLQDRILTRADRAAGLEWLDFAQFAGVAHAEAWARQPSTRSPSSTHARMM